MALEQDSFEFFTDGDAEHTLVTADGPYDLPVVVARFFGVEGESHLVGQIQGRNLSCDITLQGYNTRLLLQTDLDTLSSKAGTLTGTLTETVNSVDRTFIECTFLGWSPQGPPIYDGSAANGWVQFARLHWRQRLLNA